MKKIKKKKRFIILFLIIIFSCSSNDDSNNSDLNSQIIGNWKITESIYGGDIETLDECAMLLTFEFKENNKLDINEYDQIGNNLDCIDISGDLLLDYFIDGNILTYTNPTGGYNGGEFTRKYNILELTEQILTLELYYEVDGFENDGNLGDDEIWVSSWTRLN